MVMIGDSGELEEETGIWSYLREQNEKEAGFSVDIIVTYNVMLQNSLLPLVLC